MIALDTNLLVYAHRPESPFHDVAFDLVRGLAEGRARWGLPWSCLHEFLGVVTHGRIFDEPSSLGTALDQVDAWLASPSIVTLGESRDHWRWLRAALEEGRVTGPRVHDARVAAVCRSHGVQELWSADRDFSRFAGLRVVNPLVSR